MRIMNTKEINAGPVKALIYGQSGAGKTTLARTLKEPTLIISAESGLLSLGSTNIDYIDLNLDNEGQPIAKELRYNRLIEIYKFLQTNEAQAKYKNVFLDSLSELGDNVLDTMKQKHVNSKDGFKVWGDFGETMINVIRAFRDLQHYNVFMSCLEELDKDEMSKRFYGPQMPGKIAKEFLVPAFDLVMRLAFVEGKRVLITQGTETVKAKDRSGKLNPIEQPDLSVVMEKIRC